MKIASRTLFLMLVCAMLWGMTGCMGIKETGQLGSYGPQADWYDVTRVEHIPDPVRMQVTVVTKYQCTGKLDTPEAGQSQYTGCTESMRPQTFS